MWRMRESKIQGRKEESQVGVATLLCTWEGNLVQVPSFLDGNLDVVIQMLNMSTL